MADDDRPRRLLVVEDDEPVRILLVRYFERQGMKVDWVDDGLDAVKSLRAGLPDLMLLDVRLPGLDGFEILQLMRKEGWNVPVLMLSASEDVATAKRCLTLGARNFFTKPVSLGAIQREVYGYFS